VSMDYETLSDADQLLLARDLLRAKESDHFRLSLVKEPNTAARLEELVVQIEELKGKVAELESDSAPKPRARRKTKKDE
jgi:cell division protein FtsB